MTVVEAESPIKIFLPRLDRAISLVTEAFSFFSIFWDVVMSLGFFNFLELGLLSFLASMDISVA